MQELSVEEFRRRYGPIRASMSFGRTVKNGDFVYGVGKIKLVKPEDAAKKSNDEERLEGATEEEANPEKPTP